MADARVGLMFTADVAENAEHWVRYSLLLTTKCELFWLSERCMTTFKGEARRAPKPPDIVIDIALAPLDRETLRPYLAMFPEMFLRVLGNFKKVATTALEMREKRQERTRRVVEKLSRMNDMIGIS